MLSYKKYLNPLYKETDEVTDFSKVEFESDLEKDEYPYLETTVTYVTKIFKEQFARLDQLEKELEEQIEVISNETGDDKAEAVGIYNKILKKLILTVERINKELSIIDSPYFGKIVLNRHKQLNAPERKITTYIGKFSVFDSQKGEVLVTDWRAPIANVYYTNSGPTKNVKFTSPIGELTGDLEVKRQFEISKARISHIYDAKSGNISADEFLLAQLKKRIGKKLADIVATIQLQQNTVIRDEINKMIVLQGVAGSGKTTIVLHRLAYLFYTYPKEIHPEKTLIVAPNRMFLDYISDVLPSLGISNAEANTYLFWAKKVLGWGDKYIISSVPTNLYVKKEKGSIEYIQKIKTFFEEYETKLLEDFPYSGADLVVARYYELKKNYPNISLLERLNLAIERALMQPQFDKKVLGGPNVNGHISETTKKKIEKYVKDMTSSINIYRAFLNDTKYNSKEIQQYSKETFKKTGTFFTYTIEDLAPLVWIQNKIHGNEEFVREYIVVDEAQDMSPFELFTLYLFAKKQNLFLAGDLAQSIIPPFHIKTWEEIITMFKDHVGEEFKHSYYQFNKCYRTTVEIIEYANRIFTRYFPKEYMLPEAVLRHGDNVKKLQLQGEISEGKEEDLKILAEQVNKQFELGAITVAIICKDDDHARETFETLIKHSNIFEAEISQYSENNYKTGILVIPVSKAKGLEFDSVFLADVNEKRYSDCELDIRLLYVSITRPLHRLFIITNANRKDSKLIS